MACSHAFPSAVLPSVRTIAPADLPRLTGCGQPRPKGAVQTGGNPPETDSRAGEGMPRCRRDAFVGRQILLEEEGRFSSWLSALTSHSRLAGKTDRSQHHQAEAKGRVGSHTVRGVPSLEDGSIGGRDPRQAVRPDQPKVPPSAKSADICRAGGVRPPPSASCGGSH